MELFAKIIDCIQPSTILAKHFILGVSHGYEYASDKTKQNPGTLSQKIRTAICANFSTFTFHFIFTLLPSGLTLLITNSIHLYLI